MDIPQFHALCVLENTRRAVPYIYIYAYTCQMDSPIFLSELQNPLKASVYYYNELSL